MNTRNKYVTVLAIVILVAGGFWYYSKTKNNQTAVATNISEEASLPVMAAPVSCSSGFKTYSNEFYGFSFCMPEDAEVLPQFEAEDGSELDLIFVRQDDMEKLGKQADYPDNAYLAILKSGISAFMLQRLKTPEPANEEWLKQALPTELPCPDKSLGCTEGDILNVKLLEWAKIPSQNLLFKYKDEVSAGTKKKWNDVGFIQADSRATYQMESVVPSNPINAEALQIMAESFR